MYTSYHRKGSTKFEHARTHYGRICVSMAKNKYMAKRKRKEKMSYNKMALKIFFLEIDSGDGQRPQLGAQRAHKALYRN